MVDVRGAIMIDKKELAETIVKEIRRRSAIRMTLPIQQLPDDICHENGIKTNSEIVEEMIENQNQIDTMREALK